MNDFKVEPLGVALGVHVILQPEVVLNIIDLDGSAEVSRFEARFKDENIFLLRHTDGVLMAGVTDNLTSLALHDTILSLRCEFGQVLKKEFVELRHEVSLSWLLPEEFVGVSLLFRREQHGEIRAFWRIFLIVRGQMLVPNNPCKGIVDHDPTKLLPMKLLRIELKEDLSSASCPRRLLTQHIVCPLR